MKLATGLVIGIFMFVAVFGFAIMCHDMSQDHMAIPNDCIVAFMGNCVADGMPMVMHHISAYQSFSSVVLSSFFGSLVALVLLGFVVLSSLIKNQPDLALTYIDSRDRWRAGSYTDTLSLNKKISWLSLLENSPSFA